MATVYVLWCREDQRFSADNSGRAHLFPTANAATSAAGTDPKTREDVLPKRGPAKTWDAVAVTIP